MLNILFLLWSTSGPVYKIFKTKMLTAYFMLFLVSYVCVCVYVLEENESRCFLGFVFKQSKWY